MTYIVMHTNEDLFIAKSSSKMVILVIIGVITNIYRTHDVITDNTLDNIRIATFEYYDDALQYAINNITVEGWDLSDYFANLESEIDKWDGLSQIIIPQLMFLDTNEHIYKNLFMAKIHTSGYELLWHPLE